MKKEMDEQITKINMENHKFQKHILELKQANHVDKAFIHEISNKVQEYNGQIYFIHISHQNLQIKGQFRSVDVDLTNYLVRDKEDVLFCFVLLI